MNVATAVPAPGKGTLNDGQRLALHYFAFGVLLFLVQMVSGLIIGAQYLDGSLLYGVLDFNVVRTVHINAMIVWMLGGMMGAVYWFLEEESGRSIYAIKSGFIAFWALVVAVLVTVAVYVFIQYGPGNDLTLWFINEGREYLEAPRWTDVALVVVMSVFFLNVFVTFNRGQWSGISGVLVVDLVLLATLYLAGMFYTPNLTVDQHWWWWVIHLWVEATWEVLVGCLLAWGLMYLLGVRRSIVTTWLYIEVALVFGSGILGLGHHYFWIGTPEYWLGIGGFFSALEPIPLVAMVVHSVYDAGVNEMRNRNHPALAWLIAHTFGNFLGAGVWGFMQTLPQVNIFTHGTQWSSSHGHFAFFGAYATIIIAVLYIAAQTLRKKTTFGGDLPDGGWKWKTSFVLLNVGMLGMVVALLIAGYMQSYLERGITGSSWGGYLLAQGHPTFFQAMAWRELFGVMMFAGLVLLIWDLLTIGRHAPATDQADTAVPAAAT